MHVIVFNAMDQILICLEIEVFPVDPWKHTNNQPDTTVN